jgi:hypothetical protein
MTHGTSIARLFRTVVMVAARRRVAPLAVAVLSLGLSVAPGWAAGPLTLVSSVTFGYRAFDVILDGTLAYVATEKGLTILDISNPTEPVVRGSVASIRSNRAYGLAKKGSFVYLAAGRGGMQVIDVSNPSEPLTVGRGWVGGIIYDVAVHPTASAAYAASYGGELYVWDITNPAAPRLTQQLGVLSWRGSSASNLESMRELTDSGSAYVTGVSTAGNYVFAGDWNYGGLYVWDSSDPLHLTFKGTHRTICLFRSEADVARGVVYMLVTWARWSGVYTVPLSLLDPFVETRWDTCAVCGHEPSSVYMDGGGIGISPNGTYVISAGGRNYGELRIIDVSDPADLVTVAMVPIGRHYLRNGQGMGVAARGNHIYVAAGMMGFRVYSFPGLSD